MPIWTRPICFTGSFQFLTNAASPAQIQSTKLTQSLRLLSMTMNARALKHKSAGNYQVYVLYTSPITNAMCHWHSNVLTINAKTFSTGHEKAKIESEFNYKACCNDNTGLQKLGSKVYQPSTCSQRSCFYDKYLPFSLWISKQVR